MDKRCSTEMWAVAVAAALWLALGAPSPVSAAALPPALAPFGANDPVPKLSLKPHPQPKNARETADTFLARMATGYDPEIEATGRTGGTMIGGDWAGYEKAWSMLAEPRSSLNDFQTPWAGTARIGVVQLAPRRSGVCLHHLASPCLRLPPRAAPV